MTSFLPRLILPVLLVLAPALLPAIGIRHDVDERLYVDLSANTEPFVPGEFPDFAAVCAVGMPARANRFEILGSGTLVAPGWVLTAAHVVIHPVPPREFQKDLRVRFGPDSRNGYLEREVAEVFVPLPVSSLRALKGPTWRYREKQVVHAEFHDVALLRLARPMNDITPIRWAGPDASLLGRRAWVAGYGDWATGDNPQEKTWTPAGLRRVAENVVDRDLTTDPWGRRQGGMILFDFDNGTEERNSLNFSSRVWDGIFGSGESSAEPTPFEGAAYPGDSGGPAIAMQDGQWRVIGISGYGTGFPPDKKKSLIQYGDILVFSRVPSHAAWIDSVVGPVDPWVYELHPGILREEEPLAAEVMEPEESPRDAADIPPSACPGEE